MQNIKFSDKPIDWSFITKDLLSHYAPKIPFKYLATENDNIIPEKADILIIEKEVKKRVSLKQLQKLGKPNSP